jgi:hypothetical protein
MPDTQRWTLDEAALRKRLLNDRLRKLGITGSRRKRRLPPNATTRELRLAGFFSHFHDS